MVQSAHQQEKLKEQLLSGTYEPALVRGVQIPKPGGQGVRQLGIPTVVDRLVQQALLQVLEPIFDPNFSESSYGFRPGRGAHNALQQASQYVSEGRAFVVDLDLEKFFDRVQHDVLMARIARKVRDKRVLAGGADSPVRGSSRVGSARCADPTSAKEIKGEAKGAS